MTGLKVHRRHSRKSPPCFWKVTAVILKKKNIYNNSPQSTLSSTENRTDYQYIQLYPNTLWNSVRSVVNKSFVAFRPPCPPYSDFFFLRFFTDSTASVTTGLFSKRLVYPE